MRSTGLQRRLAAIMAADVAGYSRLMAADEDGTLARLRAHRRELVDPAIAEHRGRIVKLMGDGMLVEFGSVVDAVECAAAVQRGMAAREADLPEDRRMRLRVGIHLGDVIVEDGDIYGDGVNVAARLEGLAEPGGIAVSGDVCNAVRNKVGLTFEDLGERRVRHIAEPIRIYRVPVAALGGALTADRRAEVDPVADAPPVPPDKPSIVVLPFDNMSGDPEQAYFSDGISEDIITDLSKVSGLFVIARNSAFTYRGRGLDLREVGRQLGVRYVLEGSVRKAGIRVRITAQLIDGATGGHLWAERYDRELTDIFAVQDEVTREIVAALRVRLRPDERRRLTTGRGTDRIEAYDCFLRGRELAWLHARRANAEARPLLERAIALDPGFAAAHAALAYVVLNEYINGWSDAPEDSLERAHRLACQAVALDDLEPEAHFQLGDVLMWLRRHDEAIAEAGRAIALSPSASYAHSLLGLALHYAGRSEEALDPLHEAMRLDPHYPDVYLHSLAQSCFSLGRYEDAVAALNKRLARNPESDSSRVLLAACYGHLGRTGEARAAWAEALRVNPDYSPEQRRRVLPYRDPAEFERVVEGLTKAGLPR